MPKEITHTSSASERVSASDVEFVTTTDILHSTYDRLGLDELFETYATDASLDLSPDPERLIRGTLAEYAVATAEQAWQDGDIDVNVVRVAFERIYDGMDAAAAKKLGYGKPSSRVPGILAKLGISRPQEYRYMSRLDDKYWSTQFGQQYGDHLFAQPRDGEDEKTYLARYIYGVMHGFPWAHFSYIR